MEEYNFPREKVFEYLMDVLSEPTFLIVPELLLDVKEHLEEATTDGVIRALTTLISTKEPLALQVLDHVIQTELAGTEDKRSLFRESSLSSNMIQNYFALTGSQYLKTIFQPLIKELTAVEDDLETNSTRIKNKDDIAKNSQAMIQWSTKFIEAIVNSSKLLPRPIRTVCRYVHRHTLARFSSDPEKESLARNSISAFLFLRFLALGLVSQQYGLIDGVQKKPKLQKNLIRIAKVIQTLSNGNPVVSEGAEVNEKLTPLGAKFASFVEWIVSEQDLEPAATAEEGVKLPKEIFESQCAVFIKFMSNSNYVDTSKTRAALIMKVVPYFIEKTGKYEMDMWPPYLLNLDKMCWIGTTKDWFTSEHALNLPPNFQKLEKLKKMRSEFRTLNTNVSIQSSVPPVDNLTDWIDNQVGKNKFTLIVTFRGSWCAQCHRYMKGWSDHVDSFRELGGDLVAICAEDQEIANKTKQKWQLNYQVVGDPSNQIADFYGTFIDKTDFYLNFGEFKNGITQPSLILLDNTRSILYYWKTIPTMQNFYGARDRPTPLQVLTVVLDHYDVPALPPAPLPAIKSGAEVELLEVDEQKKILLKLMNAHEENMIVAYQMVKKNKKEIKKIVRKKKKESKKLMEVGTTRSTPSVSRSNSIASESSSSSLSIRSKSSD